jgi:uncharacterized protein (TIGR03000 family)
LQVPANAEIWFDGAATRQTGTTREFISPPLKSGHDYSYQVRVRATNGDQSFDKTRRVDVRAGDRITLDFGGANVRETVSAAVPGSERRSFYPAGDTTFGRAFPTVSSSASDSFPAFVPSADWGRPPLPSYEPADMADYNRWAIFMAH